VTAVNILKEILDGNGRGIRIQFNAYITGTGLHDNCNGVGSGTAQAKHA
jgi:hypothetical protein